MNLAAALMAADARLGDVKNQIEAVLYSICAGWQSWEHLRPYGISVYGALDSPRAAAVLHARGFVTVVLHDHLKSQHLITCRCPVHEIPVQSKRGYPAMVKYSLVTAADERERCCVSIDGVRCDRPTAWILRGAGGEMDDITHVCGDHLELARRPGDTVERV